jgi:hypothetical protein
MRQQHNVCDNANAAPRDLAGEQRGLHDQRVEDGVKLSAGPTNQIKMRDKNEKNGRDNHRREKTRKKYKDWRKIKISVATVFLHRACMQGEKRCGYFTRCE